MGTRTRKLYFTMTVVRFRGKRGEKGRGDVRGTGWNGRGCTGE